MYITTEGKICSLFLAIVTAFKKLVLAVSSYSQNCVEMLVLNCLTFFSLFFFLSVFHSDLVR